MDVLKTTYAHTDIEPIYVGGTSASISTSNGELLLATPLNEDVIITNLDTNEIIYKIPGDGEVITNLTITPDGSYLAMISQSQLLRIFDLNKGSVIKNFKLPSPVYISSVDSTSSLFAFGGSDGVITVWDIENGYVTHSLKGHGTTICSLTFHGELNSQDWRLASGDTMGTVKIWDLVKRRCIHTLKDHNTAVRGVGFDQDGDLFISGGRDNVVIIYNTKNFKTINTFPINEQIEAAGFVSLIDDRQYFYTGGSENVLKIWDIKSGEMIGRSPIPLKTNEELLIIDVIKLYNNNLYLVISDQTLIELDLQELTPGHGQGDEIVEFPIVKRIAGNQGIIADIKYVGPEFNLLAMATNSPALRIVDIEKPLELRVYEGHTDILNAVDVSTDGKWIATASKDNEARLWRWNGELQDFEPFARFQGHAGAITAISLSKSQNEPKFLITGSSDLTIKKWKIPNTPNSIVKTSEYTRRAHDKDINSIDVSPNDEYFATASYDKLGKVWQTDSGETIGVLKGHKRGLWDINFYKFDKLIVTGSGDKTIKVWSLLDFSCKKTLEGHTNSVQRVKFFNREHPQLLSCGADGLIKLWDYKQEEIIKSLDNHDQRIWAMDLKNDGEYFTTADADGKLSFWTDNTEEEVKFKELQAKEKIEQEQSLSNYIKNKDWSNAFLLALTLDHSMRLYNVIKSSIETNDDKDSIIGSFSLENTISLLDDGQLVKLFKKIRDWNVNFKFFEISQKLLNVVLNNFAVDKLTEVPGLMKIMESIIPYNERHYNRIEEMVEQTYVLDYTVEQMNKLIA
ncbi:hypothetical protein L150_04154 [Candida albicans Ca529L]|nr:hypothetical protein L150_04154 [Candida albicans Ca529L]